MEFSKRPSKNLKEDSNDEWPKLEDSESLVRWRTKLAGKCQVSVDELPDYIACIDRCIHIVYQIDPDEARVYEYENWIEARQEAFGEWAALYSLTLHKRADHAHSLTLQKGGDPCIKGVELRQHKAKWRIEKCVAQGGEGKNENQRLLKGIIQVQVLKLVGDSTVKPEEEEEQLIDNIWQNVAASVNFFTCAMAYERRYRITSMMSNDTMQVKRRIQGKEDSEGSRPCKRRMQDREDSKGLRPFKRRKTLPDLTDKLSEVTKYTSTSLKVLQEYKSILTQKLPKPIGYNR